VAFSWPGGVCSCPGGVAFSRPGGVFSCPGGPSTAPAGTAAAGDGDGVAGIGLGGVVVAGGAGDGAGACFGCAAPALVVGRTVVGTTGATGAATTREGGEIVYRGVVWCRSRGIAGA